MPILQTPITILLFFVILGGLVLVHEVGHFVVARLSKIRVLEFGVGFPPRARVLGEGSPSPEDVTAVARRRELRLQAAASDPQLRERILDEEPERARGTLYTLNWLPIGGFVRLEGEDGDSDDERSFVRASYPTKVLVLLAGVAMNLLVAFVIFFGIAAAGDPAIGITFSGVQDGSPAQQAGLQAGELIVSLDGRNYNAFDASASILDDLRASAGTTVVLGVKGLDGVVREVPVTLRSPADVAANKGALGITGLAARPAGVTIHHDLGESVRLGVDRTVAAFGLIANGLGQLVNSIATKPTEAPPVSGPIGIAAQIGDVFWQLGPIYLLYLTGLLSANLALVNILPFPPLDGGRLLMITLQKLIGNRITQTAERLTYLVGFAFLMVFLVWISFFDILRLGGGTP